jgi:hypothetical protein
LFPHAAPAEPFLIEGLIKLIGAPARLDNGSAMALLQAEVTVLAAILVVATFVEAILSNRRDDRTKVGLAGLSDEFWARKLATSLIICGCVCIAAMVIAVVYVLWGGTVLEILTLVTFAVSVGVFFVACVRILRRMRKGGGRN